MTLQIQDYNHMANHWRNRIGVNVIPANTATKKPLVEWKNDPRGNWQVEPIPQDLHDEWIRQDLFKDGIAIGCGKTIPNKELKYFVPKICATIPLVGGTVESHKSPNVTPKIIEFNKEGGEKMKTQILIALTA